MSKIQKSYGGIIAIEHAQGYTIVYAHNAKLISKVERAVNKGDTMSLLGNTVINTGPHLHFEIKINDNPTRSI